MLQGMSLKEAQELAVEYDYTIQMMEIRKSFQEMGCDLSSFSDDELARGLGYISKVLSDNNRQTSRPEKAFSLN
jgi:hypothetical protein